MHTGRDHLRKTALQVGRGQLWLSGGHASLLHPDGHCRLVVHLDVVSHAFDQVIISYIGMCPTEVCTRKKKYFLYRSSYIPESFHDAPATNLKQMSCFLFSVFLRLRDDRDRDELVYIFFSNAFFSGHIDVRYNSTCAIKLVVLFLSTSTAVA